MKIMISGHYFEYWKNSLYMESHFNLRSYPFKFPASRNINKEDILGTDRTYDEKDYPNFYDKYQGFDSDIELCLYDDNVRWDEYWFSLYKQEK